MYKGQENLGLLKWREWPLRGGGGGQAAITLLISGQKTAWQLTMGVGAGRRLDDTY